MNQQVNVKQIVVLSTQKYTTQQENRMNTCNNMDASQVIMLNRRSQAPLTLIKEHILYDSTYIKF